MGKLKCELKLEREKEIGRQRNKKEGDKRPRPNKEIAFAQTRENKREWHLGRMLRSFLGPRKRGAVRMSLEY